MYQKTYILDKSLTPEEMNRQIAIDPHYQNCCACLMQVYEPTSDRDFILDRMRLQRDNLPRANIVGMPPFLEQALGICFAAPLTQRRSRVNFSPPR